MLDFLGQYGLFLAKTVTVLAALVMAAGVIANLAHQARAQSHDRLHARSLNRRLRDMASALEDELLDKPARKARDKARKAQDKADAKARRQGAADLRRRVFVLDFRGDLRASQTAALREEISALLQVTRDQDEVLVRLESEGGIVHGYGLAASQLKRVRHRGLKLTVAIDKVAASGGYLMACVADRIIAAPFAIVGSIGVVGQLPNFNRLLKKHEVDYELHTAGQYKRTLTLFGENTAESREKFRQELEEVHALFKSFVTDNRPQLAIDEVATGEHWYGTRAIELKLVDELKTSDDWLLEHAKDCDLLEVTYKPKSGIVDRLSHSWSRLRGEESARDWPMLR